MTQISPISTGTISVNTNLGKRANPAVISSEVKNLVTQLFNSNPNITEDQVKVEVNNYLQTIERNGTKIGKARIVELAKLPETIKECRPKPVVTPPVIKPQPVMKAAEIPTESLIANSPIVKPEIQTVPSKKEEKLVKKLEKQGVMEAVPQGLSERTQWEEQEAKKTVSEPPKSNKQNKKEVNSQYMSSKKKKIAKKQAEIQSQAEHKKARLKNTRTARNASYCTKNGIISSEVKGAKEAYNLIKQTGEKTQTLRKEAIAVYPDNKPYVTKSAEESAKVFMENGFKPIVKPSSNSNSRKSRSYGGGSNHYYQYGSSSRNNISSATASTASTVSAPVKNTVKNEVVTEIKEVIKEVPKTNKWLVAGAVVTGGVLGWLGTKLFSDNNKQAS